MTEIPDDIYRAVLQYIEKRGTGDIPFEQVARLYTEFQKCGMPQKKGNAHEPVKSIADSK